MESVGSVAEAKRESRVERHAWKVLLGLSAIVAMFGITDMNDGGRTFQGGESVMFQGITGMTWGELQASNPRVANLVEMQVRGQGSVLLVFGLLSMAVCLTALKRGERWAWYAMWLWPLWCMVVIFSTWSVPKVPGAGTPIPLISGSIFLVPTVVVQVLSYRKYFPLRG